MGQVSRSKKSHLKSPSDVKNKSKSASVYLHFWTVGLQCTPANTTRDTGNHPLKTRNATFLCLPWGR
eukprot:11697990-Ditylum_brightwellii.AAC.1